MECTKHLDKYKINEVKIKRYKNCLLELKEKLNKELIKTFDISDNKIYINFFFFELNKKIFCYNNDNNILFKNLFGKYKDMINNEIYNLMIQWIYFLYMELINNIYYYELNINTKAINQIKYIFEQTIDIIIILYNTGNYYFSVKSIFNILNFLLFLIENNCYINYNLYNFDKYFNIKNYILLKVLFYYIGKITNIILNKANEKRDEDSNYIDEKYKEEINLFFDFLKNLEDNNEINYRINKNIILNNNLLDYIFKKQIFEKINIKIIEKYEMNFMNKLIHFYSNFIIFNYSQSKIFDNIIEALKNSFIHLSDFNIDYEKIYKDFFVQEFYIKLIKNIIFYKDNIGDNKNIYSPLFNSFFFNSYDSQIKINIKNKKYSDNISIFFSINLLPKDKNETLYPIFLMENNNKSIIFNLSLKYKGKGNEYSFIINNEDKENKIFIGTTYYINISFNQNKIFISYYNEKDIYHYEIKVNQKLSEIDNIIIGKNEKRFFSGYIGPIIIIKNSSNLKENQISDLLKLKKYYYYFVFLKKDYKYYIEYLNLSKNYDLLNYIHKEKFEKFDFECLLYLNPNIINNKKIKIRTNENLNNLQNIYNTYITQKYYEIKTMNVTLVKNENAKINFINENGINYIILLFEYIYQFLRFSIEKEKEFNEELRKNIISIIKNALEFIEKYFSELHTIRIFNLNKSFKNLFMNLFQCLKLLLNNYYIMDDILDNLFRIAIIYKNSLSNIETKGKNTLYISNNKLNDIFQINNYFINGFLDFLLTPEIYDFSDSDNLLKLFGNIKSYFNFHSSKEASMVINSHFFHKLFNFSFYLKDYFNIEKNIINDNNSVSKSYFGIFKQFFENDSSKNGNFNYLKYIFRFIENNIDSNFEICLVFLEFINDLLDNNPDYYFSDIIDIEQIEELFSFIKNISLNKEDNKLNKIIIINNRNKIINKIIAIIIKILFTKKRMNSEHNIIKQFINSFQYIDINNDLIENISEAIEKIIENIIGIKKNKIKRIEEKEKSDFNEFSYLTKFYSEIFNLILFFFEYPFNNNINNITDLNKYEENIFDLLNIIGSIIESNLKSDLLNIDNIYCLIHLLKLYYNILFKRLYPEKYINEFIKLCKLCSQSCLIYSNVLLKFDNYYKTILEIILDIFLNYIIVSSNHYYEPLNSEKLNGLEDDIIFKEQEIIYNYLKDLLLPIIDKDDKKISNIFSKCDYLNYMAENEKKKKQDKKDFELKEFQNYKIIYNFFFKKNKFYLDFSIFFLIKLFGYNKLLMIINVELVQKKPKMKELLKYKDMIQLIGDTIRIIYKDYDILYKNKDFLKHRKKYLSELEHYNQVKKIINDEITKKDKKNFLNAENYITKDILGINELELELDFFNDINSGKFCKIIDKKIENKKIENKKEIHKVKSEKEISEHYNKLSNEMDFELIKKEEKLEEYPKSIDENKNNIKDENSNSLTNTEETFNFEDESSSSGTNDKSNKNEIELNTQNIKIERTLIKAKTINVREVNNKIYLNSQEKIKKFNDRKFSENYNIPKNLDKLNKLNEDNKDKDIQYLNYFDKPDAFYLKNTKKELMMNIFSFYFSDIFFNNKNFRKMKKKYLQNMEGVNELTKLLNYPTKIKNYSNGLEHFLFLKPFPNIFYKKTFHVSHGYFYEYMKNNKNKIENERIILYKKIIPEFKLEDKFNKKCELIKINKNYYGHIKCYESNNFLIFEELKFDFYDENNNIKNNNQDMNDLFTLTIINKQQKISLLKRKKENKVERIFEKRKREKKIIIIIFDEIEEIIEKRFLLMWQAIEIYLKNGKSYFFNFLNKENCQDIINIFKKNKITKEKIQDKDYIKKEKYITNEWIEGRLSTDKYLLYINKYGSRSFNDTNQYPIFPWLIRFNEENKRIPRNLKYPMAAQIESNKDFLMKRYIDDEDNNSKFPYHFGTHYSTSAYVYFYLMRIEPFTSLLIKLQGNKQEDADRMFYSFDDILSILNNGRDNREVIPELFNNVEIYLNLNCSDFGIKKNKERIDDFNLEKNIKKNNTNIYQYIKFVFDNKKYLNDKKIANEINNWIDIIFGVEQLPKNKERKKKGFNIFYKESYEQNLNLNKKMKKLIEKGNETTKIINKITSKINLIISFGQTPYQIFDEKHPKFGKQIKINEDGYEFDLTNILWSKELKIRNELKPLFFVINSETGIIFIIDKERRMEIIENTLYSQKENKKYQFIKYGHICLPYIKFFKKIKIKRDDNISYYYIINQKYCISLFEEEYELYNIKISSKDIKENENFYNNNKDYHLYYYDYIKRLEYENKKNEKKGKKKKEESFKFITCRHIDNSFKLYNLPKSNIKKDYKPISFICEDFVSSCCTISYNKFIIGLKNGKLIEYKIEDIEEESKRKEDIKLELNKQIKDHKDDINLIEIDKRLGIIITAGNDNILNIRKIYDFELLIQIKIKEKYIITLAKISPLNYLYILCFNKKKEKSQIFGYTLNGIFFAKSSYELYDTLDFTKNGNIVTWLNKSEIKVLNAYNLEEKEQRREIHKQLNKLNESSWIKFDYFSNKNYLETNTKIITYTNVESKNNVIKTLDISNIDYFK